MVKGPSLLPGETILHAQERIRTLSSRCGGKYSGSSGMAFAIPFLTKWTLFITNRRIHFATTALCLVTSRKDFWFADGNPESGRNIVQSVDNSGGLGITVAAHNALAPQRPATLVLKFGFREVAQVANLIQQQMKAANRVAGD